MRALKIPLFKSLVWGSLMLASITDKWSIFGRVHLRDPQILQLFRKVHLSVFIVQTLTYFSKLTTLVNCFMKYIWLMLPASAVRIVISVWLVPTSTVTGTIKNV